MIYLRFHIKVFCIYHYRNILTSSIKYNFDVGKEDFIFVNKKITQAMQFILYNK